MQPSASAFSSQLPWCSILCIKIQHFGAAHKWWFCCYQSLLWFIQPMTSDLDWKAPYQKLFAYMISWTAGRVNEYWIQVWCLVVGVEQDSGRLIVRLPDVVPINEVYNCAERTYWISTEGYFPSSTSEKYALYSSSICCWWANASTSFHCSFS